jgi:virginiamycin B lyase
MRAWRKLLWVGLVTGHLIALAPPALAADRVKEYPIPTASSVPLGITTGPDGNVWFTGYGAGKIERITPKGAVTFDLRR